MAERFTFENFVSNLDIYIKEMKRLKSRGEWTHIKHNSLAIIEVYMNHKVDINKYNKEKLQIARDCLNCVNNIIRVIKENREDRDEQFDKQIKLMIKLVHSQD